MLHAFAFSDGEARGLIPPNLRPAGRLFTTTRRSQGLEAFTVTGQPPAQTTICTGSGARPVRRVYDAATGNYRTIGI
jgi:hypothetical protein